jgi:superfamily II RNA helicase
LERFINRWLKLCSRIHRLTHAGAGIAAARAVRLHARSLHVVVAAAGSDTQQQRGGQAPATQPKPTRMLSYETTAAAQVASRAAALSAATEAARRRQKQEWMSVTTEAARRRQKQEWMSGCLSRWMSFFKLSGFGAQGSYEALVEAGQGATLEQLQALYPFEWDAFQTQAVVEFLAGKSVVVCAPTSAGKTLVAEAASVAMLARGQKLIYTTPLKVKPC